MATISSSSYSCKVDRDPWWGVHLESKVTNPQVTITSRSCCAADYGNSMNVYIIDKKWPGSNGGFPPPNGVAIRTHKSGAKKPFDECGGDCDHDSDCRGDLMCFQRGGSTANAPIPGCSGSAKSGYDYCVRGLTDLSTGQPSKADTRYSSTSYFPHEANDGNRGNMYHGSAAGGWWGVTLKREASNPKVTIFARSCCTNDFHHKLKAYLLNDYPSSKSQLDGLSPCATFSSVHNGGTYALTCSGTGTHLIVAADRYLELPEVKVEAPSGSAPITGTPCAQLTGMQASKTYKVTCTGSGDHIIVANGGGDWLEIGTVTVKTGAKVRAHPCPQPPLHAASHGHI